MDQRKAHTFVHESDAAKGGASLDELQNELSDSDLRQKLFDGRSVTEWHRATDFQLVSYAIWDRTHDHTVACGWCYVLPAESLARPPIAGSPTGTRSVAPN